ncbi:MAG: hypothetical protein AAGH87_10725 [Pseudomonadota bacterium]
MLRINRIVFAVGAIALLGAGYVGGRLHYAHQLKSTAELAAEALAEGFANGLHQSSSGQRDEVEYVDREPSEVCSLTIEGYDERRRRQGDRERAVGLEKCTAEAVSEGSLWRVSFAVLNRSGEDAGWQQQEIMVSTSEGLTNCATRAGHSKARVDEIEQERATGVGYVPRPRPVETEEWNTAFLSSIQACAEFDESGDLARAMFPEEY